MFQNIPILKKLRCYQLKIDGHNYKIFYGSLELITMEIKPLLDTQKIKIQKSKQITTNISSNNKGRQIDEEDKITAKETKTINNISVVRASYN